MICDECINIVRGRLTYSAQLKANVIMSSSLQPKEFLLALRGEMEKETMHTSQYLNVKVCI